MLTSDLVRPTIRTGTIAAPAFPKAKQEVAATLSAMVLETLRSHVGQPREAVDDALATIDVSARDLLLFKGIKKLALDGCTFESPDDVDPPALRRAVFIAACAQRAAGAFDRDAVLSEVAKAHALTKEALDRALFADLKSAQLLLDAPTYDAAALVELYRRGIPKAILLKAERVTVELEANAASLRRILHRLKFMRLLFALEASGERWRLTIDGPMSMFSGQARYGLKLAQALDVFEESEHYELDALIRWGKRRLRLNFHHEGGGGPASEVPAREEVERLVDDFEKLNSRWTVERLPQILTVPKVGACVTDLAFVHQDTGEVVHLEVLGYWSREAVFKRVDLVEAGLDDRVIFAFSERLRVSEKALAKDLPSTLLPFKGVLRATSVLKALDASAGKGARKKAVTKKRSSKKAASKKAASKKGAAKPVGKKKASAAKKRTAKKTGK